jgi:excisionase family DNA binding protein
MTSPMLAQRDKSSAQHKSAELSPDVVPLIHEIFKEIVQIRTTLSRKHKDFFTIDEVAQATGRAPYTVRTWVSAGRIKAIRVAGTGPKGRLLVPREELAKLIASGRAGEVPASLLG